MSCMFTCSVAAGAPSLPLCTSHSVYNQFSEANVNLRMETFLRSIQPILLYVLSKYFFSAYCVHAAELGNSLSIIIPFHLIIILWGRYHSPHSQQVQGSEARCPSPREYESRSRFLISELKLVSSQAI